MKVLIVTNQFVEVRDDGCYCITNFNDIINQFSSLGELSLCAVNAKGNKSSNLIDKRIEKIQKKDISFITKNRIFCDSRSKRTIDRAIEKVDIVVGYVPCINAEYAIRSAHAKGKKTLSYVVACIWDALWNHSFGGKVMAPFQFLNLRHVLRISNYALYVTDSFLQKRYPCKGPSLGCSDVRIPSISDDVLPQKIERLLKGNFTKEIKIVTTAAINVRYKGQRFVIKALARLKKQGYNNFHYYMIGNGSIKGLQKLAKSLGVESQVHFIGVVHHDNLFSILDQMHIYAQPSLQEGLPRSVVEAMSRGLLCFGFNTGAIPELLPHEYIVEKKNVDGIVNILKSFDNRCAIQAAKVNIAKAQLFTEEVLNEKRNTFFNNISDKL